MKEQLWRSNFTLFDRVRVEPRMNPSRRLSALQRHFADDAIVAVGGGSTIDTAKAANLYACWPADLLDYVNPPIGKGKPVPGPLKPLIAIPTTAGTGSETTGVAIFDYKPLRAKNRDRPSPSEAHAGHRRSREYPDAPVCRGRIVGSRCALPRHRILHCDSLAGTPSAGPAYRSPRVSGFKSHRKRYLEYGGAASHCKVSATRRRRPLRRRSPRQHDAGRGV